MKPSKSDNSTKSKSKTQVIHGRQMRPGDIYVGRSCYAHKDSGWGNPFKIGVGQSREQVIAKYRKWVVKQPQLMARLGGLKGKRLACWCKPAGCHGDVRAGLVEEFYPDG